MQDGTGSGRPTILRGFASISSAPIAAVGFAMALYLYELQRMSSLRNVTGSDVSGVVASLAPVATALLLALAFNRRSTFRLHRHTVACFAVAGVMAASVLYTMNASIWPVNDALRLVVSVVLRVCETLLLLCWGETLLLLTARQAALVCSAGFVCLGLLNALSSLLREGSSSVVMAMLPLLSVMCLYWFKDRSLAMNDALGARGTAVPAAQYLDCSLSPVQADAHRAAAALTFLLPLLCCPLVFGYIHYAWLPAQDGGRMSMLIQLSAALGTVLGGVLLFLLVENFWGRRKLALYNLFTLVVMTLTFALTGFFGEEFPVPYVVLLNVAQKIVFFFVWMSPFLLVGRWAPLSVWCVALSLYGFGKAVSNIAVLGLDSRTYGLMVALSVVILVVGIVLGIVLDQGPRHYIADEPCRAEGVTGTRVGGIDALGGRGVAMQDSLTASAADRAETVATGIPAGVGDDECERACATLAKRYHLTGREEEVLGLLAQGMVAVEVARALVVSNSTAKTHMRNLYAKMGVHSQTELVLLISQERQGSTKAV